MAMFKKYMEAIYTSPGILLSSNNNHRNQSKQTDHVDIKRKLLASITFFISFRLYLILFIKAQGQRP